MDQVGKCVINIKRITVVIVSASVVACAKFLL